jgi:hypothetical protein
MLSMRHGTIRGGRRERPVNVLAIYVANELIQSRMEEAVAWRMANQLPSGPSLRDRVASAAAGLRRLAEIPVESAAILPKLDDYPYRS